MSDRPIKPAYYCMHCPEVFYNAEASNAHHDATGHHQHWSKERGFAARQPALPETAPMTDSADRGHPMSDASLRRMHDEYGERSDPPYALVGMLAGEVLALRAATVSAGRLREAARAHYDAWHAKDAADCADGAPLELIQRLGREKARSLHALWVECGFMPALSAEEG